MRKFFPIPNVSITCTTCPQQAEQIVEFLDLPLNQRRMLAVPDRQLYRNRSAGDV